MFLGENFVTQGGLNLSHDTWGMWIIVVENYLNDLKVKSEERISLYCYNKEVIFHAYTPIEHDRTKHIEIDLDFIKEKLDNGLTISS